MTSSADAPVEGDAPPRARRASPNWPFRLLLFVSVMGLSLATFGVIVVPIVFLAQFDPELDLIVNTATMLTVGAVAAIAWIRFKEFGQADSLFQSSAFLVLFASAIVSGVPLVLGLSHELGFAFTAPGQAPLYIWSMGRVVAGVLLLVGAIAGLRNWHRPQPRVGLVSVLIPTAVVVGLSIAAIAYRDLLPPLVPDSALAIVTSPIPMPDAVFATGPMLTIQLVVAMLFFAGAAGYARLYERERNRPYTRYLAAGLVVAAFSEIRFAIMPGVYEGVLTIGDGLRVGFDFLVLTGVALGVRHDLGSLRRANIALVELRQSDATRIALEERARLAREVHDGLVQELWLARLTQGRLAQMEGLPEEARETVGKVDRMLEDALAEARQAVVALQPVTDDTFNSLLGRIVEDYGDRFGLEISYESQGEPVHLSGHVQAEVLRVCREALNNVRKHADAALVRVLLEADKARLRLTINDNGSGFDTEEAASRKGFGLRSMRERAEMIGGRLDIESAEMEGTTVVLELDMPAEQA